ncbi:MAG: hypothetical protein ABIL58_27410 [Pseudomonadota bacterium]
MMKSILRLTAVLLAVAITLALVGCRSEIPEDKTIVKNGRLYRTGDAAEPFSGIVTGIDREPGSPPLSFRKRYVNGLRQGDSNYFYPNGKLARQEPYKDDRINGILTCYYENGRLQGRAHVVDGERGGEHGEVFFPLTR